MVFRAIEVKEWLERGHSIEEYLESKEKELEEALPEGPYIYIEDVLEEIMSTGVNRTSWGEVKLLWRGQGR